MVTLAVPSGTSVAFMKLTLSEDDSQVAVLLQLPVVFERKKSVVDETAVVDAVVVVPGL